MKKIENVSFIIKTCERPMCISRLVRSIRKYYKTEPILIADDSENPCFYLEKKYKNVKVYKLEKDSGLAYGRNYLVDKVETEFFVLCDDDFVFDKKTDVIKAIEIVKEKKIDILGGYFRNYEVRSFDMPVKAQIKYHLFNLLKIEKPYNHMGTLDIDEKTRYATFRYISNMFPEYQETEIVHNIFVAKTKLIKEVNRWKDCFILGEHAAFFLDAKKNNLKVGFSNCLSVEHKPVRTKTYVSLRNRDFNQMLMEEYDIKKLTIVYDGVVERIIERKNDKDS